VRSIAALRLPAAPPPPPPPACPGGRACLPEAFPPHLYAMNTRLLSRFTDSDTTDAQIAFRPHAG